MPQAQGYAGAAIARLVSLVPRPKVNLTRFHSAGESDPHVLRAELAMRGKGKKATTPEQSKTPAEPRVAMTWPFAHILVLRGSGTSCPMGKKTKAGIQD